MSRDSLGMDDLQAVHIKQILEARQRVVAQMLMIDRVVLESLDQRQQVMRFGDENAVLFEQV